MAARSNPPSPKRRKPKRLDLASAPVLRQPRVVPTRWVNGVIAVFLIPLAALLTQTFFNAFSVATLERDFWATDEFWFFGLGCALWTLWFFGSIWALGEPRPLRAYIFGHELTHAIWVWLCNGRVADFKVCRTGGYILTNTNNFWVALAPYFYPIYSMALIVGYGVVSVFYDPGSSALSIAWTTPLQWFFASLGVTWAFHISFTCWMIPKGQTDLTYHGTFFSLLVIYLVNVLLLSLFLIVAEPDMTFEMFGNALLHNAEDASAVAWQFLTGAFISKPPA